MSDERDHGARHPGRLLRRHTALFFFTLAYMVGFGAWALLKGNNEFLFYWVTMLVLIGMVVALHWRTTLPGWILWGLSVWGFLHMAGGNVPIPEDMGGVLYNLWIIPPNILKYDQVVHAYGFFFAAMAAWTGLRSVIALQKPAGLGVGIIVACIGMGLGAANEVVEFIATLIAPETNVGGYRNTAMDLVFNMGGATLAAIVVVRRERRAASRADAATR